MVIMVPNPTYSVVSQPRSHHPLPSLQREETQLPKKQINLHLLMQYPSPWKRPRGLASKSNTSIRISEGVSFIKDKTLSSIPPVEERQKYTYPPHLDPSYVKKLQRTRAPISPNKDLVDRSHATKVIEKSTQPSLLETSPARVEVPDMDYHIQEDVDKFNHSNIDPLQQENEQDYVEKSKSSIA